MSERAPQDLEQRCINTIRFLSVDAVQKANSGHPGMPMGAAPAAYVLWTRHLKVNPADPVWPDRDRFVLSAGHGSMLLYSLLHLCGFDLSLEDIKAFRQWGSRTPGHPEHGLTAGVETTTGPLGQGFANAVGMAIAEAALAARFNRPGHPVVDHFTYVLDERRRHDGRRELGGRLAGRAPGSGQAHRPLRRQPHLHRGQHRHRFHRGRRARFAAYGWHTRRVADGNDVAAIDAALAAAKAETARPSLIAVRSHIGYGSPHKQDSAAAHGAPLGPDEVKAAKENLGWPLQPDFFVPDEVRAAFCRRPGERGAARRRRAWEQRLAGLARRRARRWPSAGTAPGRASRRPAGTTSCPVYTAGRRRWPRAVASGAVLNALAPHRADADRRLRPTSAPSNNT